MKKNEEAIRLLDEWLADESGYDGETWPHIKHELEIGDEVVVVIPCTK